MDSSTVYFIATLVVAFVFLRWFISSDESDEAAVASSATASSAVSSGASASSTASRPRRVITSDMIEVVQSIGPQLTEGQIKMELLRSGSVEATIERFLNEGTLPYPRGEAPAPPAPPAPQQDERGAVSNVGPENLLEKYAVKPEQAAGGALSKPAASLTAEERASVLQHRKAQMILNARKRLEAQLKNEQDLSPLAGPPSSS